MKRILQASLLSLTSLITACTGQPLVASDLGDNPAPMERRIVVTFVDRSINRNLPANAQDLYQMAGSYNNSAWSDRVARRLATNHRIRFVAQWPVTELGVSCVVFEIPNELPIDATVAALQNDKEVASVQTMRRFDVLNAPSSENTSYSDPYLPLQKAFNSWNVGELHQKATGRGVRIALIDSGVDVNHPDLKGQIAYNENTAPEPEDHNLADKHGTAVAGVLSARADNGIGIAGVAPDAEVMAFRACWPEQANSLAAHCNTYTLALALNKAMRMQSRIINLSLSGPEDPLLKVMVEKAVEKGIVVIAAVPPKGGANVFPGNVKGVLGVSQDNQSSVDAIIAPGLDILTTVPNQAYDFMTGSSFATPHVAGLAALMLQQHPEWTAEDIRSQLKQQSTLASVKH